MSGTLYVVATPIGNLEDITLRAIRVLREASVIAAEDTRHTAKLLSQHSIATRMISFHAHNARTRVPQLVARLLAGEDVALVTDAGTPGVSDPGLELTEEAIRAGIAVEPIPGASAPLTAVIASGFPLTSFTVFGFAPSRSIARKNWLREVGQTRHTFTFFETPHRIAATLADAADIFGDRPIVVARELTKMHQEFLRGTASELAQRISSPRGEYTIVVGPVVKQLKQREISVSDHTLSLEFGELTNDVGFSRRDAIRELATRYGMSSKLVYSALERTKN